MKKQQRSLSQTDIQLKPGESFDASKLGKPGSVIVYRDRVVIWIEERELTVDLEDLRDNEWREVRFCKFRRGSNKGGEMTPLEMIAEWRRGCSCAPKEHPEECHECTRALINALEKALKGDIEKVTTLNSPWYRLKRYLRGI